MKAIMISGRTLGQGASCEAKMTPEFFRSVSVCSLSEEDYASLGVSEKDTLEVRSEYGSAILSAREDNGLPPGLIFIPMGPWANALVSPDTAGCGTPQFKGVPVEVKPSEERVKDLRELFQGGKRP